MWPNDHMPIRVREIVADREWFRIVGADRYASGSDKRRRDDQDCQSKTADGQ